jgi:hypothetical protein
MDPVKKARALLVNAEAQTATGDKTAALRTIQEAVGVANTLNRDASRSYLLDIQFALARRLLGRRFLPCHRIY